MMVRMVIEFDSRFRFPYRVVAASDAGIRSLYSKHKTRGAAETSLAKRTKAEAYFETVKCRLANEH